MVLEKSGKCIVINNALAPYYLAEGWEITKFPEEKENDKEDN